MSYYKRLSVQLYMPVGKEEGIERQVKVLIQIWQFLSMSHQAVSAVMIQNSARVTISWLPHKFQSLKTLCPFFLISFPILTVEFFAIFSYC
jgi:hypothetical protein